MNDRIASNRIASSRFKARDFTGHKIGKSQSDMFSLRKLLSFRSVKDSFDRKLTTIVLTGREMRGETRRHTELSKLRAKPLQVELLRVKARGESISFHLLYLFSIKDVEESLS